MTNLPITLTPAGPTRSVRLVAGSGFLAGASATYAALIPEQLREYRPGGLFLGLAAVVHVLAALALLVPRPLRWPVPAAITTNLVMVAAYLTSLAWEWPLGPDWLVTPPWVMAGVIGFTLEVASAGMLFASLVSLEPVAARPNGRARSLGPMLGTAALLAVVGVACSQPNVPLKPIRPAAHGPSVSLDSLRAAPGTEPVKRFTLEAKPAEIGGTTLWTYNGVVPGPELRVTQGDRIVVTLVNHLSAPTTIHWHGVVVPGAEDGVAGVTQDAVAPDQSYQYEFVAREAGTYWYHSHQDSINQIPRGLFGALVVEPPGGRVAQQFDHTVFLHPTGTGKAATVVANNTKALHLNARAGSTVRLRLIDAMTPGRGPDGGPVAPVLFGAPYRVVALDGRDLNDPSWLPPQRLTLGMGRRADIVFTMPRSGAVQLLADQLGQGNAAQRPISPATAATVTIGTGAAPAINTATPIPLFDLTRYGKPAAADGLSEASHFDASFPVVLAEKPIVVNGKQQLAHMINSMRAPEGDMFMVEQGWTIKLHMVNNTAKWHPMHLHGHALTVLSVNGQPLEGSPVRLDTVLVGPHETWDVAFVADNPGLWMFHCHLLLHASMGMGAMVMYAGVTAPYRIGGRAGNNPDG